MSRTEEQGEKIAAGGVVIDRLRAGALRVLLVHRPRYDDWSFPKGGVEAGESLEQAALREVREETGVECSIVRKLSTARYSYKTRKGAARTKVVHYYLMEPVGGSPASASDEVDGVEWLDAIEAQSKLSYERDRDLLASVMAQERG